MKKYFVGFLFAVVTMATPLTTWAVPIGDITFGGTIDGSVNLATTNSLPFTFALVTSVTPGSALDAAINVGDVANFSNLQFDPFAPGSQLWTVGGVTLDLTTLAVETQNASALVMRGTGTFSGGFGSVGALWSASIDRTNGSVAFSSVASGINDVVVPEPATLFLVGSALILLGRRYNRVC